MPRLDKSQPGAYDRPCKQGSPGCRAEREQARSDPFQPDAGHAAGGTFAAVISRFGGGGPLGPPPFSVYPLFSGGMWKKPGVPAQGRERTEGERPGSGPDRSDGKPCSGVRGDQQVSTEPKKPRAFSALFTGEKPRERETLRAFARFFPV